MRVLYVAKHGSGGNDDEGAVARALESLGHAVVKVQETYGYGAARDTDADFLLFHKWHAPRTLAETRVPRVCWYFDLVDYPDATLAARCAQRRQWMAETLPVTDLMLCTDGDWVEKVNAAEPGKSLAPKAVWLPQGADVRVMGPGDPTKHPPVDLFFTGVGKGGGLGRESWVNEMKDRYGDRFLHVPRGLHGRELADRIACAKIVLAPDHPVTERYWSNRVYNVLGFGGFLLHPFTGGLVDQYDADGPTFYYDRVNLRRLIDDYLRHPKERSNIAAAGYERTKANHTYVHRVETLVRTVKERLGL